MKYYSILLLLGVCQIYGNEIENEENYDPGQIFLIKTLFSKLNTLLEENAELRKQLADIDKRQALEFRNINDRYNQQENVIKQLNTKLDTFNKTLNIVSLEIKDLKGANDWQVIQRRQDGSVDFYRNWEEYKQGFGNQNGEFFIGLQKLHELTTYGPPQELLIILKDFEEQERYAKYDKFVIGNEAEKYAIKELGQYSGDAGNSFGKHKGYKFSTSDQNNRIRQSNCATTYKGGWWYTDQCYSCHLNGPYLHVSNSNSSSTGGGIEWSTFHGLEYSLKFVEMMIRPKS